MPNNIPRRASWLGMCEHVSNALSTVKTLMKELYFGSSRRAAIFRHVQLVLDLLAIASFVVAAIQPSSYLLHALEVSLGSVLLLDFMARLWMTNRKLAFFLEPLAMIDLVVVVSLLAPVLLHNLAFLRVLRAIRLVALYRILGELDREHIFPRHNQEIVARFLHLTIFILLVTEIVYSNQQPRNVEIGTYIDALYFTVTTLTTTGFGDITLIGQSGRLLSVVIMIVGISLFLRLAQAVFSPSRTRVACTRCRLQVHEQDAAFCRRCGASLPSTEDDE